MKIFHVNPISWKLADGTSFDAFRVDIVQGDRILFPEEESGTGVKANKRLNSPDQKSV